MSHTSTRINKIANIFKYDRYLEIGVYQGKTFLDVSMKHKTAVDIKFGFKIQDYQYPYTSYFTMSSDSFFEQFSKTILHLPCFKVSDGEFKFDII